MIFGSLIVIEKDSGAARTLLKRKAPSDPFHRFSDGVIHGDRDENADNCLLSV